MFIYFIFFFQEKKKGEAEGGTGYVTMSVYDYFTYHGSNGLCWPTAVSRCLMLSGFCSDCREAVNPPHSYTTLHDSIGGGPAVSP